MVYFCIDWGLESTKILLKFIHRHQPVLLTYSTLKRNDFVHHFLFAFPFNSSIPKYFYISSNKPLMNSRRDIYCPSNSKLTAEINEILTTARLETQTH